MTEEVKKNTRKINKTAAPDVEVPNLKELDKNNKDAQGNYVGTQVTSETLEKADTKRKSEAKLGKNVTVQTVSGGNMYYFDAGRFITGDPTVVPDSSWLQFQIERRKIKLVE